CSVPKECAQGIELKTGVGCSAKSAQRLTNAPNGLAPKQGVHAVQNPPSVSNMCLADFGHKGI
ncbi:unnamed protein product, partial [Sphenostylis stenocarpa]